MAGILKVDKYQDFNGNDIMTSDGAGNITLSTAMNTAVAAGSNNTPAFQYYNNGGAAQSIPNGTWTEVTVNTTPLFDTNSLYNSSTNRFTPNVAGKYYFYGQIYMSGGLSAGFNSILITKNSTVTLNSTSELGFVTRIADGDTALQVSGILSMNGTTDYVSVYINQQAGVSKNIGGSGGTSLGFFGGYKLIGV